MNKKSFLLMIVIIAVARLSALSQAVNVSLGIVYGDSLLRLDQPFKVPRDSSFTTIETLKFYISGIAFMNKGQTVFSEHNSFHLMDFSKKDKYQLVLEKPIEQPYDHIRFYLGIDSVTNVSGAMGGDLDPTKGMYWTWQNGYVNFKLEGTSSLCQTRHQEFQFHLGGYQYPYSTLQEVVLRTGNLNEIDIRLDLEKIIDSLNLSLTNKIMSPSEEAVALSSIVANAFSISAP